jgi:predicted transcriptional regulator
VAARAAALREEMTLEELRKARDVSQDEIANALAVGQPAVAKLEKPRIWMSATRAAMSKLRVAS